MFPAVADMARAVAAANQGQWRHGCDNGGTALAVHCCHSTDLRVRGEGGSGEGEGSPSEAGAWLPRRADLLTSELLDSTLLAEGVLPTVRDAWRRLLRPGAAVLPAGARVWAQVLASRAH